MNKTLYKLNLSLLVVNVLLYFAFTSYTVAFSILSGVSEEFCEFQLVAAIIYEFAFFAFSKLASLKLKVDLSYKGKDFLRLVPKPIFVIAAVFSVSAIVFSAVKGICAEFPVSQILMLFSILLESGITRMFKISL